MSLWIKDPGTDKESVSVTLLVVACVLMVVFIFLECFIKLRSTYLLDEFFGACMALYGGKMITRTRAMGRIQSNEAGRHSGIPHSGGDISPR